MTGYKNITIERDGPAALLSIARPEVMNALNDETILEIGAAVEALDRDESVRGVILTGGPIPGKEGKPPKHSFISGADINELAKQTVISGVEKSRLGQSVLNRIEGASKPMIAAINGFCFGGGFELALACHWRYASTSALIGLPECTLGIIPGYGGTQRLARLIGRGLALELLCTGARFDGEQALRYGIVNRLTSAEELLPAATAAVAATAKCAPLSVRYALEATRRGLETTLEEGLRIEADLFGIISSSEDMREGLKAFLEKRPAHFNNR